MTDSVDPAPPPETFQAFKDSFFYGSRSNLDFKFLADLSETEAGEFFTGLLTELSQTINDGDGSRLVDLARVWQQRAYMPTPIRKRRSATTTHRSQLSTSPYPRLASRWSPPAATSLPATTHNRWVSRT